MVRTFHTHCWRPRFDLGQGSKILQATWCGQKIKKKKKTTNKINLVAVVMEIRRILTHFQ